MSTIGQAIATPSDAVRGRADLAARSAPLVAVLALTAYMVVHDGGFAETVWHPVALLVLGVAATVVLACGRRIATVSWPVLGAIGCLAAFTAWSFASIAWAASPGDAWNGSNRDLLYLLVFVLLAAWPTTSTAVWPTVLAATFAISLEGVLTVEQALSFPDPWRFMIGSRLSEPLGYPNATGALFMMLAWLMIGLASRPWLPAPVRGLAFGLASIDLTLNLLTESRGSIYTLPLVAAAYLAVVPGRLRSLFSIALVGLGVVPVVQPILDVYTAGQLEFPHALSRAMDLGLAWAGIMALAGWLFASIDNRLHPSQRVIRVTVVAIVVAAVVATAGFAGVVRPWHYAGSAWHNFKYTGEPSASEARFGGLGSARYDFWRVGLIEFKRHPIQGLGTDNFLNAYLPLRRSHEQALYPHSLVVDLLSQTGVIGTALFVAFIAFTVAVVIRIPAGRHRELAGVLTAGAAVWLIHGMVDWLWEFPALGVLGMALLGTACGLAPRRRAEAQPSRRLILALSGAALLATVALAATLALPWIAERDVQRAIGVWRENPAQAFSILSHADSFDPLSNRADLVSGAIASRLHQYGKMRSSFADAVARSPDDWYANLELGIAASLTGDRRLAASALGHARRLNPREPVVRAVLRTFTAGRRIDSDAVDRTFAQES
jgi:O-Antigen ligase